MQREILQHLRQRQGGVVTLAVGVLLLVLITLVTLYGARVGLMEQRISGNEYRAKLVSNAAETGRGHATEYLNANLAVFNTSGDQNGKVTLPDGTPVDAWLASGNDKWGDGIVIPLNPEDCPSPYTPADCEALLNAGFTGRVFFYNQTRDFDVFDTQDGGAGDRVNINAGKEGDELRVSYNADFVLCPLNMEDQVIGGITVPRVAEPPDDLCTDDIEGSRFFAILVRSEGYLLGEDPNAQGEFVRLNDQVDARTSEVLVKFDLFGAGPQLPLTIGGAFSGGGSFNIVANPNGGPATEGGGRSGAPFSVWTKEDYSLGGNTITCQRYEFFADNPGSNILFSDTPPNDVYEVCYDCSCPNEVFYQLSSGEQGGGKGQGIDIVDNDADFPDDLFLFTFGVPREDHEILKEMAQLVSDSDPDAKYQSCSELQESDSGLIWVENDACDLQDKVGTPHNPVVLISEGNVKFNAGAKMFGVIYVFGGSLRMNGNAQIYGAVVGDPPPGADEFDASGQGTNEIIYDQDVLNRVAVSPDFQRVSPMPGTWTDRRAAP